MYPGDFPVKAEVAIWEKSICRRKKIDSILTVGLVMMEVSGNRMAGSSEVTELVMLVSAEKKPLG